MAKNGISNIMSSHFEKRRGRSGGEKGDHPEIVGRGGGGKRGGGSPRTWQSEGEALFFAGSDGGKLTKNRLCMTNKKRKGEVRWDRERVRGKGKSGDAFLARQGNFGKNKLPNHKEMIREVQRALTDGEEAAGNCLVVAGFRSAWGY